MARIHFLNVKEGDCSIIQHENGHVTMIDVSNAFIPQVEDAESAEVIEKAFAVEALKGNYNQKANPTNPIEYLNTIGVTEIFRYIQTHPDIDHISGLFDVFAAEDISIEKLVMNCPWKDADFGLEEFEDGRITFNSLKKRLQESFGKAYELVKIAEKL